MAKISARNSFICKRTLLLDFGIFKIQNPKEIRKSEKNPKIQKKSENPKSAVSPLLLPADKICIVYLTRECTRARNEAKNCQALRFASSGAKRGEASRGRRWTR